MRSFLKIFFASFLSLIVFCLVVFFFFAFIIASAASSDKPSIEDDAVLVLDLSKPVSEQAVEEPLAMLTGNDDGNMPGLYDVVRMLNYAKTDDKIKGLYIKANGNVNGYATSQTLRSAIEDFKKSKKFVIAYGEVMSQQAYYVASAANKVYCHPEGGMEWSGMSVTLLFMKNLLEKLEIQPQIFYAGKFKSATEPFRETKMTDANRIQTKAFLEDLFSNLLMATSASRNIDTATLRQLADDAAIQTAKDAVKYKLIDGVKYDDQIRAEMLKHLGQNTEKEKINFVSLGKYAKAINFRKSGSTDKVAIIYAEGDIVDGKKQENMIASEEYVKLLRKARLDKNVKAIVLRVNSPGGSALASDVIWREIILAKKIKPVVVSMGDYAASGGYYISCAADSVFAEPGTLTGSIGVFGIIPNLQGFFNNKLGITFDGVKTSKYADMGGVSRPLNEFEKRMVQASVDTVYATFKNRVANGRKLKPDFVDSIAQGRVWTGKRAVEIGLVDRLGNMNTAIQAAAKLAKLKDFSTREYPEKESFFEKLMGGSTESAIKESALKAEIGDEYYLLLKQMKQVKQLFNTPQARLPFDMQIK